MQPLDFNFKVNWKHTFKHTNVSHIFSSHKHKQRTADDVCYFVRVAYFRLFSHKTKILNENYFLRP